MNNIKKRIWTPFLSLGLAVAMVVAGAWSCQQTINNVATNFAKWLPVAENAWVVLEPILVSTGVLATPNPAQATQTEAAIAASFVALCGDPTAVVAAKGCVSGSVGFALVSASVGSSGLVVASNELTAIQANLKQILSLIHVSNSSTQLAVQAGLGSLLLLVSSIEANLPAAAASLRAGAAPRFVMPFSVNQYRKQFNAIVAPATPARI